MKKLLVFFTLFLIGVTGSFLLPQTTSGQKGKFRRSENGVKDRYIVVLNDEYVDKFASDPAIESEAYHLTGVYGGEVKATYASALKGFVVELPERAAIALSQNDRVAFVEQDAEIQAESVETAASWGLDRMDQRSLPLNSQYSWNTSASNVNAYIIDSGIRPTHADFGGRATADYDALSDGQNGIDCYGHGTHVAGTIGGATYGVAKNVRLHGVRVLPCSGSGLVSHLIMGINWVTANHIKPAVANISITISTGSSATDTAIQNSVNAGVTYVVAAGNSNLNACNYSPGRVPSAITVGALNSDDSKAGYSNFGSCVDVWAPGTGILSTWWSGDLDTRYLSGTSMASPHVTGVAALYLAANPNASPAAVANGITSTSTDNAIGGLDGSSPNKIAYSILDGSPPVPEPPAPARVAIIKRTSAASGESTPTAAFPYDAANLAAANFVLQPDNQFVDPNVTSFGSGNVITVTEAPVLGWRLTSISCVENSGAGKPNIVNSTVDLTNRRATIIAEEGEQVDCTFTSEPLAPTASNADITGRVAYSDGRGVKGVSLSIYDAGTGYSRFVTTNSFGYFTFRDLPTTHFYIVTANSTRRVVINNNVRAFTLTENVAGVDFQVLR
ncbi:MAG: S8 family serine peptidase [Pyrinomonadaceae bacterium]